jgi:thiamine biosynthesis protein ThiI
VTLPEPRTGDGQDRAVVLVRWGEIFLKGDNRAFFEKRLLANARRATREVPDARIERIHGRLLASAPAEHGGRLLRALGHVFGVSSLSPAARVPRDLDAISAEAVRLARAELERRGERFTFKVETRRSDKRFRPTSLEVSREVGAEVVRHTGLPVDVHHPALEIGVEISYDDAFVFGAPVPGPGGLPVGVSGKVELLLSGGIDSPVAGWMMLKRGCELGATYFHSFPYTGDKSKDKVARLARRLAAWQLAPLRLKVVHFTDAQKALRGACDGRLAVVLYRRMMVRVAERIARADGKKALVTGEALAQVASQTLDNLAVISAVATLPVLRPLVGHDKLETIQLARRVGTYDLSIEPYDDCCSLFVPDHPETRARLDDVLAAEATLDVDALADQCAASAETMSCER